MIACMFFVGWFVLRIKWQCFSNLISLVHVVQLLRSTLRSCQPSTSCAVTKSHYPCMHLVTAYCNINYTHIQMEDSFRPCPEWSPGIWMTANITPYWITDITHVEWTSGTGMHFYVDKLNLYLGVAKFNPFTWGNIPLWSASLFASNQVISPNAGRGAPVAASSFGYSVGKAYQYVYSTRTSLNEPLSTAKAGASVSYKDVGFQFTGTVELSPIWSKGSQSLVKLMVSNHHGLSECCSVLPQDHDGICKFFCVVSWFRYLILNWWV